MCNNLVTVVVFTYVALLHALNEDELVVSWITS
jgi:hypothetical protein